MKKPARSASPHGHPSLGITELQLLRLLRQGPATTSALARLILLRRRTLPKLSPATTSALARQLTMNHLGLKDPDDLTVEPARSTFRRVHKNILGSLHRLESKGFITGERALLGTPSSGPIQLLWWRLLTERERASNQVDHNLNQHALHRIWSGMRPTLKRVERWRSLKLPKDEGDS